MILMEMESELYWDQPKELWSHKPDGSIEMYTRPLDLDKLVGGLG